MPRIYTKRGDKGHTNTIKEKGILKNTALILAIGEVDELNCFLGSVVSDAKNNYVKKAIPEIQNDLFLIGSLLSGWNQTKDAQNNQPLLNQKVTSFEKEIDSLSAKLPKLQNFILPGGGKNGSNLHLARAVSRRCERATVSLLKTRSRDRRTILSIIKYLNRLSDYLFVLARWVNLKERKKETIWKI